MIASAVSRIHRLLHEPRGVSADRDIRRALPATTISTIFDVGANIGQSARRFRQAFPAATIFSFEPDPENFIKLQASGVHSRCLNIALGDRAGQYRFDNSASSVLRHLADDQSNEAFPFVAVSTVDAMAKELGVDAIDYLKIDTEGNDLAVLKGAQTMLNGGKVAIIETECSASCDNRYHAALFDVHSLLEEHGLRLFGIYNQVHEWPDKRPNLRRVNVVYISPQVIEDNPLHQWR